jgi:hypothetical protein
VLITKVACNVFRATPRKRVAPKPARAIFDFNASHSYEISLTEGQVITVLETVCHNVCIEVPLRSSI